MQAKYGYNGAGKFDAHNILFSNYWQSHVVNGYMSQGFHYNNISIYLLYKYIDIFHLTT